MKASARGVAKISAGRRGSGPGGLSLLEGLNARLRSAVVNAREMSKKISASPGVREVGESVVALYTPEGDSIALSTGIMVHVHTLSRFIQWMIEHDYETDPGIAAGDVFANNDPF